MNLIPYIQSMPVINILPQVIHFFFIILILSISHIQSCPAQERISLAGNWKLSSDSIHYNYTIRLPGSTDEIKLGEKHENGTNLYNGDSEVWQLARKYVYIGPAWYHKEVIIPKEWASKRITLLLERCMWQTKLWINGNYVGEEHSLCTPHQYDITECIKIGYNRIDLRIDNSPYVNLGSWSHAYSPGIQTIWNGAIGELYLEAKDKIAVEKIQCYPSLKNKNVEVKGCFINLSGKSSKGKLIFRIITPDNKVLFHKQKQITSLQDTTQFSELLQLNSSVLPWDEFSPNLYMLEINYKFGHYEGKEKVRFGFRDFTAKDGRFLMNGYTVFFRGEHDAGSFPQTGYPSMKIEDWLKIFRIGKEYGLNHWRFHSWCPPEAAFDAADEVGIYLQPELPLFSQNWEHTLVGQDSVRDVFLFSELQRLLDTYGNHPSFLLMCMGNELKGDASGLEQWVAYGKKHDKRHLYASSANLEAMGKYLPLPGDEYQVAHAAKVQGQRYERRMGGIYNSEEPNTENDYSHTLVAPYNQYPIITHEIGQWEIFPDLSEISRYNGVLAPRNLEIFKSRLEQKGMGDMAPVFLKASGKTAAILYKEEMERVLRTPEIDGFQILDLRDYPAQGSALVGLLNVFWDNKGIITPEAFRQSCNDVVLLLKMPKRVWTNNELFYGEIVIPNYYKSDLKNVDIQCEVSNCNQMLYSGSLYCPMIPQGKVSSCGKISFTMKELSQATKLEIVLKAPSLKISNKYEVWVYPEKVTENAGDILIAEQATPELLEKIKSGTSVLLVPKNMKDLERTTFTPPFWSTILFDYQPKTMGIVCDPNHPVFKDFPTDGYTNWQWWELLRSASVARINKTPVSYRPIVQAIDHPIRNDKLGVIMETQIEKGKLLICMLDILSEPDKRIVARQLKHSILNYMNSSDFCPKKVNGLEEIFFANEIERPFYTAIILPDEDLEYPASNMLDEMPDTYCQLPANADTVLISLKLNRERYITGCKQSPKNIGINSFKIYVTNEPDKKGNPIIIGDGKKLNYQAVNWDNGFTIQKGKKGKYILFEIYKHPKQEARLYELELLYGD